MSNKKGFIMFLPAIIIGFIVIGTTTTVGAQSALPGDFLYGLKTTTEQIRIKLAVTEKDKLKTYIAINKEKIDEVKKLDDKGAEEEKIQIAEDKFENTKKNIISIMNSGNIDSDEMKNYGQEVKALIETGNSTSTARSTIKIMNNIQRGQR